MIHDEYSGLVSGEVDLLDDYASYEVIRDRLEMTVHRKFEESLSITWLLVPIAT